MLSFSSLVGLSGALLVIEAHIIDGVSISQYSIFADSVNSGQYFIDRLTSMKRSDGGLEHSRDGSQKKTSRFTPFSIPAYIKVLAGDEIT